MKRTEIKPDARRCGAKRQPMRARLQRRFWIADLFLIQHGTTRASLDLWPVPDQAAFGCVGAKLFQMNLHVLHLGTRKPGDESHSELVRSSPTFYASFVRLPGDR